MKKRNYPIALMCALFLLSGCKKEITKDSDKKVNEGIKVENGHLSFDSYDAFLAKFQNISSLSEAEREKWEKSIGFESLNTIYKNFDAELTHLENSKSPDPMAEYAKLKIKYQNQFLWTDSTYSLNCSGVRESYLANKDGVVKIGDDLVYFRRDGIETYSAKSRSISNPLNKLSSINRDPNAISIIPGSQPSTNSFNVKMGSFNVISNGDGKFYSRIKLYNIHSSAAGYRGFVSMECYAQHKNIIGIWHDVRSLVSARGVIYIDLNKADNNNNFTTTSQAILVGDDGTLQTGDPGSPPPPAQGSSAIADRYELLLASSVYLKNNPNAVSGTGSVIDFGNLPATVNDDFLQPNGYWSATEAKFSIPFLPFRITAFSISDGIGGKTINYPLTNLYW